MKRLRKEKWGYLFLLPWFCFFIIFTVYPFLYGFKVSFYDYTISRSVYQIMYRHLEVLLFGGVYVLPLNMQLLFCQSQFLFPFGFQKF